LVCWPDSADAKLYRHDYGEETLNIVDHQSQPNQEHSQRGNKLLPLPEYVVYDDMINEVAVQTTLPTEQDDKNPTEFDEYWLNEIKSQEDTARLLITISMVILGTSATIIMHNLEDIKILFNNANNITITIISTEMSASAFQYLFIILFIIFFSFFFEVALKARRPLKPLEPEQTTQHDQLIKIASIKHKENIRAINRMTDGIWVMISLISVIMTTSLNFSRIAIYLIIVVLISMSFVYYIKFRIRESNDKISRLHRYWQHRKML
jgi:hypothetical protein